MLWSATALLADRRVTACTASAALLAKTGLIEMIANMVWRSGNKIGLKFGEGDVVGHCRILWTAHQRCELVSARRHLACVNHLTP